MDLEVVEANTNPLPTHNNVNDLKSFVLQPKFKETNKNYLMTNDHHFYHFHNFVH